MIDYQFDENKVVETVAYLLQKESVDQKNYTKLLKVIYLCDREALKRWGKPITGDRLISMPNGTLLSRTYDLIKYHRLSGDGVWSKYISEKNGYEIGLLQDPGTEHLSLAELKLIDEVFNKHKNSTFSDMINITHSLPEWENPLDKNEQVSAIEFEDVLKYLDYTMQDIHELKSERENINFTKSILLG
ncbi:Panacea domain-containing protein [Leptospira meyeri]|uniref:Panacea domain-containing protein n=1 Tax=Leptospira meyeri TaxID=29508 RepID=UPI00223DA3CE|nr:Panacea domain-containing protein [Leptospira meyeri]MCW7488672.1 Panacea domain-containing protein [Leptospira meyeri]